MGDAVEFAGVLAQLAQNAANDQNSEEDADEQSDDEQADDQHPGAVVELIAKRAGRVAASHIDFDQFDKQLAGAFEAFPGRTGD